jgi:pyridoxal phosphate enzyme (YggS family)
VNATAADIARNLSDVRSRIGAAARRAGREPGEITLIAVSKTFGADHVRAAHDAGQLDFGENKVQEALQKIGETSDIPLRWHLIGHLQSNKARKAALPFACIHSIDSLDLLRRIDDAAAEAGGAPEILVQVDLAGEETKFGAARDIARRIVDAALACRAARLAGLMLLPPWQEDQEQTRPWFVRLRELRDHWISEGVPRDAMRHLSMGMSHDFEAAIEEGATMVRVGTAIFGTRTKPATT